MSKVGVFTLGGPITGNSPFGKGFSIIQDNELGDPRGNNDAHNFGPESDSSKMLPPNRRSHENSALMERTETRKGMKRHPGGRAAFDGGKGEVRRKDLPFVQCDQVASPRSINQVSMSFKACLYVAARLALWRAHCYIMGGLEKGSEALRADSLKH